jgi:isobutyryl-CoA mutase
VVHLLGDRIRMNAINNSRVYMRSLATRQSNLALSKYVAEAIEVLKAAKYDINYFRNFWNWTIGY